MTTLVLMILGGLALLGVGVEGLVRGSAAMALRLGVTPLVVGLSVVAFRTGSPELVVSVEAALLGSSEIALGNVVGSNIALILGVAALIQPIGTRGLRPLDVGALLASAALILPLIRSGSVLNRWEGALLLAGYFAYVYSLLP